VFDRQNWKQRIFILRPSSLAYYGNSDVASLKHEIPLMDVAWVENVQDGTFPSRPHCWQIGAWDESMEALTSTHNVSTTRNAVSELGMQEGGVGLLSHFNSHGSLKVLFPIHWLDAKPSL
jgi:hypothetical protein